MIKITLSETDAKHFDAIRKLAAETALRDANFNGATIKVETGDFTSVDDSDEIRGASLLADVRYAIDAANGEI